LISLGATLSDDAIVARVISSLMNDKYRNFREAWRSIESSKQTSGLLLSRLKTWELEEQETRESSTNNEDSSRAFYVRNTGNPRRKTKEEIEEIKKRTKCHLCKNIGHWRNECPQKNQEERDEKRPAVAYAAGEIKNLWINDSGASQHYCGKIEWFSEYRDFHTPQPVSIADNSVTHAVGEGIVKLKALCRNQWKEIEIHNVQYIPGGANLFSENIMLEKGFNVIKDPKML